MSKTIGTFEDTSNGLSCSCELLVDKGTLLVYLHDEQKSLLMWNIKRLSTCEWHGSELKLVNAQHHSQNIICKGPLAEHIHKIWRGEEVELEQAKKGHAKLFVLLASFSLLLIALVLWSYFYVLPAIAEKAAALVPVDTEIQIGKKLAEQYQTNAKANDSSNYYIHEFIKQLKFESNYPISVMVIPSKEINAFALPGGAIFVYSEIIKKMKSPYELVALIGHEQSHVNKRHSLKSVCRSAGSSIVISTIIGDASGISSAVLYQAQQFEQLNYSRDLETEADDEGLQFMIRNKIDAQGMVDLLELLKKENSETPGMMKYLSTHPETESRILNVKSQMTNLSAFEKNEQLERLFFKLKAKL